MGHSLFCWTCMFCKLLEKLNLDGLSNWTRGMWLLQESSSWPSMTSSCWMGISLDAQVQLSTKSASTIVSPLKSGSGAFLHHFWMRYTLTQRHAGCGGNMPQSVPMVQCSSISSEKGWNSALLCGFP